MCGQVQRQCSIRAIVVRWIEHIWRSQTKYTTNGSIATESNCENTFFGRMRGIDVVKWDKETLGRAPNWKIMAMDRDSWD